MPSQISSWTTRDTKVRVLRGGAGSKIVFLHGAAGMPQWGAFFETLTKDYDVWAFEHPGFGKSDNSKSVRNVADVAMYYLDLLDDFDGAPVHLIGHSLGGWIAAEMAVRNSSRLATITLLSPAGVRLKGVPMGDNFIWSPEETARNLYYNQAMAEALLQNTPSDEEAEVALINRFMAAKLGWEPRWHDPALERWLHRIRIPALLLWGENDKLLPAQYAQVWQAQIPHLQTRIIPLCGHLPHVERAADTSQAVLQFLARR